METVLIVALLVSGAYRSGSHTPEIAQSTLLFRPLFHALRHVATDLLDFCRNLDILAQEQPNPNDQWFELLARWRIEQNPQGILRLLTGRQLDEQVDCVIYGLPNRRYIGQIILRRLQGVMKPAELTLN
jgi:hypothetical protein